MNMQLVNMPSDTELQAQLSALEHAVSDLCNSADIAVSSMTSSKHTKFSVVIPLYNKAKHIRETLDSVVAQTFPAFEVIVVDDGSTDDGGKAVEDYFSHNVRLVRQENKGVSAARNFGISLAGGDYVAFLDADDTWSVHFLEELNKLAMNDLDLPMLATGYQYKIGVNDYRQPKIRFGGVSESRLLKTRRLTDYFTVASSGDLPFCASSVAIKRQFLAEHGGFPTGEPMGEDQCLWSRVALRSDIAYSPRGLSFYHLNADNRACLDAPPATESPFSRRLFTYAQSAKNLSNKERDAIIRYTAAHLLDLAERNARSGNWREAWDLLWDQRCQLKPVKRAKALVSLLTLHIFDVIGVRDRLRAYKW